MRPKITPSVKKQSWLSGRGEEEKGREGAKRLYLGACEAYFLGEEQMMVPFFRKKCDENRKRKNDSR